jgi:hypothetical protein
MKKWYLYIAVPLVLFLAGVAWFLHVIRQGDEGYRQAYDFSTPAGKETLEIMKDVQKVNEHQFRSADLINAKKFDEAFVEIAKIEDEFSRLQYQVTAYRAKGDIEKAKSLQRELIVKAKGTSIVPLLEKELREM